MSNAAAPDLPDTLSDAEMVLQVKPTLGVGSITPNKSHNEPLNVRKYTMCFKDIVHLYYVICSCFLMQGSSLTSKYENITLGVACTTPQKSWSVPFCVRNYVLSVC